MQASTPRGKARGVFACIQAAATTLDAHEADLLILQVGIEGADGVAAAPHAGDDGIRQATRLVQHLGAALQADDLLQFPHDGRVGMRPYGAAQQVEGVVGVGHVVAQGLVHGVLQGAAAALNLEHFGPQHLHAKDIQALAGGVHSPHEDGAAQPQARRRRGGGNTVLPRPGLGHHMPLAHAFGQERLAQGVVQLVGAGVQQIFALEEDPTAAQFCGIAGDLGEGRGPSGIVPEQIG